MRQTYGGVLFMISKSIQRRWTADHAVMLLLTLIDGWIITGSRRGHAYILCPARDWFSVPLPQSIVLLKTMFLTVIQISTWHASAARLKFATRAHGKTREPGIKTYTVYTGRTLEGLQCSGSNPGTLELWDHNANPITAKFARIVQRRANGLKNDHW